jgi:hypothetical protein
MWQQAPQLAYVWLLTGTGTMVVNGLQPFQISFPHLGARYGMTASAAALASVYKDVAWRGTKETWWEGVRAAIGTKDPISGRRVGGLRGAFEAAKAGRATPSIRDPKQSLAEHMIELLPTAEKALINALAKFGKIDYGMVADIQAAVKARGQQKGALGVFNKSLNMLGYVSEAAFIAPQAIETTNRVVTALAEFRLLKARHGIADTAVVDPATGMLGGRDFSKLVEQIGTTIDTTQVNYERDNKPPIMQHEAYKSALVFKHYAVQQWYNITHNFLQSFKGETAEDRRQAKMFLAGWTATTLVTTGLAGLVTFEPIYLAACALMMAFGDDEDKDPEEALRSYMSKWIGDTLPSVMLRKGVPYGIPGGYGVDMSRMGLNQLFPAAEAWGIVSDPNHSTDDVFSFMGKLMGGAPLSLAVENLGRGSYNIWQGNFSKGVEQLAPKAFMLNDIVRTINYAQTGMTSRTGAERVAPEDISFSQKFTRFFGFTPSSLTEASEKDFALNRRNRVTKAAKYDLIDKYAEAALAHRSVTSIIQEIIQFNRKNPGDAMTKASLLGAVKRRAEDAYSKRTYGVKLQNKGAILRERALRSQYQTPDRAGATQ